MSQIKRQKTIDLGSSANPWGMLIPLTPGLPTHQLSDAVIVIGRLKDCDIQINDKRLSGKHCRLQKKDDQFFVTDLSTNGTYIKDAKIGKNVQKQIEHQTQIWLLPASRVKPTQALGFKLHIPQDKKVEEQVTKDDKKKQEDKKKQQQGDEKQKKNQQKAKNDGFSQSIKDQITCSFCFQIMHGPVNVQPCNHRFCGGCLTELIQNKKGDCIQCRKTILTAAKDSSFNSIIDDYLKSHPEDKRDPKQIQQLNKKNIFTFDPTDIVQLITGKAAKKTRAPSAPVPATSARGRGRRAVVRASSDLSASEDDDQAPRCRECMNQRDGFRCNASQKHVRCFTCGKLMADREDKNLHQYCVLCTQYCCNLYYPPCGRGVKLQLMKNRRNDCKIDTQLMRGNRFQFEALRNYLLTKKWTSKELFDEIMNYVRRKQFSYLFDRKIMKAPPVASRQIKMQQDDAVCDLCWKDLWFQMVFFYRIKIQADLPRAVKDRPVCYWGINCRTMDHNEEHAKRYNHIVYQTRF